MSSKTAQPDHSESQGLQTVKAVAQFLNLSRATVYQLMERGDLAYVKLGKSRRVKWADVLQLVEQNTIGPMRG